MDHSLVFLHYSFISNYNSGVLILLVITNCITSQTKAFILIIICLQYLSINHQNRWPVHRIWGFICFWKMQFYTWIYSGYNHTSYICLWFENWRECGGIQRTAFVVAHSGYFIFINLIDTWIHLHVNPLLSKYVNGRTKILKNR